MPQVIQGQKSCFLTVFPSKNFFEKIFLQKFCYILKVQVQKRQYPKFQLKTSLQKKVRAILKSKILSPSEKTRFFVSQFKLKKVDRRLLWFYLKLLRMTGTIDQYHFFMIWKQKNNLVHNQISSLDLIEKCETLFLPRESVKRLVISCLFG